MMAEIKEEFKQGRARKVKPENFYLTCTYLIKQTKKGGKLEYFYDELKEDIETFISDVKDEYDTAKSIENKINHLKKSNMSASTMLDSTLFHKEHNEEAKKLIAENNNKIKDIRNSNSALSEKTMYNLHLILVKLEDDIYKAMTSWIKQYRYRKKESLFQITLSIDAKLSLKSIQNKLRTKDYNETLIEAEKLITKFIDKKRVTM